MQIIKAHTLTLPSEKKTNEEKMFGACYQNRKNRKNTNNHIDIYKRKSFDLVFVFYFIFFISFSLPNSVSLPLDHKIYVDLLWAVVSLFDFGFFCLFSWLFVFD